jgi:valyl-tRNA synthetase
METGADLVFKWVPRMMLFGKYLTGEAPFKTVYFHGMVLDKHGKKMSKSKGNVLSPIDLGESYGMDATRMAFVVANPPGADMPLSEDKVRAYKKFANKVWNITRFTLTSVSDYDPNSSPTLGEVDAAILTRLQAIAVEITDDIESFRLHLATEKIYHYIWHELADEVLEQSKDIIASGGNAKIARQQVLAECLTTALTLLHPFMPFVTEAIWQALPTHMKEREMLMVTKWPISPQH